MINWCVREIQWRPGSHFPPRLRLILEEPGDEARLIITFQQSESCIAVMPDPFLRVGVVYETNQTPVGCGIINLNEGQTDPNTAL